MRTSKLNYNDTPARRLWYTPPQVATITGYSLTAVYRAMRNKRMYVRRGRRYFIRASNIDLLFKDDADEYFTPKEVAFQLGQSYEAVMNHINRGDMPYYRAPKSNRYRIPLDWRKHFRQPKRYDYASSKTNNRRRAVSIPR